MVDWMRDADRAERRSEGGRAWSSRDLRATGRGRAPQGPAALDGSRPLSGIDVAALQRQVGNAAVCRLLVVQRDGPDDAWTTGGSPPTNDGGAGWSTGGPPPGGAGPVEEPGYGPPGEEPDEPAADEDVELSRWLSYSGSAMVAGSRWIVIASRRRSGDEPGFDTIQVNGKAGEYGLPEPKKHPDVGGYAATVRVWSSLEENPSPTNGLTQVYVGAAFAPGSGAQLALAEAAQSGGGGAGGGGETSKPLLIRGSVGPAVKDLQVQLGLDADGIFGPATERAVRQFQADRGLDVDGMVGPKTHAELENPVPATGGA